MLILIFGYVCIFLGFLMLVLPLVLTELCRPRDWLIGGLFLFLGISLLIENDLLKNSLNLLVLCVATLLGKLISEIIQSRWSQLGFEEKKRIGSWKRWVESLTQLVQIFIQIGSSFLNSLKRYSSKSEQPLTVKKWVHPEYKDEINKTTIEQSDSNNSNKERNKELTENEETS